jgi:hypothetical protein
MGLSFTQATFAVGFAAEIVDSVSDTFSWEDLYSDAYGVVHSLALWDSCEEICSRDEACGL